MDTNFFPDRQSILQYISNEIDVQTNDDVLESLLDLRSIDLFCRLLNQSLRQVFRLNESLEKCYVLSQQNDQEKNDWTTKLLQLSELLHVLSRLSGISRFSHRMQQSLDLVKASVGKNRT